MFFKRTKRIDNLLIAVEKTHTYYRKLIVSGSVDKIQIISIYVPDRWVGYVMKHPIYIQMKNCSPVGLDLEVLCLPVINVKYPYIEDNLFTSNGGSVNHSFVYMEKNHSPIAWVKPFWKFWIK